MKTNQIISYLSANDVTFDKDFARAENEGCITEYRQTFDSAYAKLEKYVRFGLNNGFSSELKDGINETTKIIVEITGEKTAKYLPKITKKLVDVETSLSKTIMQKDNASSETNIADKVLEYIGSYSSAIYSMMNKPDVLRKNILESSSQKLSMLHDIVSEVGDVCSETALDYAKKIIVSLKKWATETASNMHNENTLKYLDTALADANAWLNNLIGVVVKKGLFSKKDNVATDLSSINFVSDGLSTITSGITSLEKITMFRENLATFKKTLQEGRFNTDEDEASLEKQKEKKLKLEKERNELAISYQNGEIDAETFVTNDDDLEFDINECREEIELLRKSISNTNAKSRSYRKVIRKVELLNKVIIGFQDDPRTLNYLVGSIDFTKVTNVLRGYGSQEEIEHVLNISFKMTRIDQFAQEKLNTLLAAFEEQDNELKADQVIEHKTAVNDNGLSREEEMKKRAEEKLKARLGTVSQKPNENVNPTPSANPINDILDEN